MTGHDRAVVFDGTLRIAARERPTPAADEALIRLRKGGICNTDLELVAGYRDFSGLLGHEFVGDVIAGPAEWHGQRVVGSINVGCGRCDMCRAGIVEHCRDRRVLGIQDYDGAFADVFRMVTRNLHRVPDVLSDEQAVFTEPLAAACQITEMVHVHPGERVVLIGAGKLGMLAAQVLKLTGTDVTVIVRHERQATMLAKWDIRAASRVEVANGQADIVVDCTGNATGFDESLQLVRPRGVVVLKSTYTGVPQADLTRVAVDEIRVVGSRCGPFPAALRLLEAGVIDVASLIEARYTLSRACEAFEHAAQKGVFKVLLEP